jgi:hypothetical protein
MKSIKRIDLLNLAALAFLVMSISALGQLNSDLIDQNGQMPDGLDASQQLNANYSPTALSGAPVPVAPSNPDSLGINIPSQPATYYQVLPAGETETKLIPADATSAISQTASDQIRRVVPSGIGSANNLYVSSLLQTISSSPLHSWLPIWMQINSPSATWFYEWNPNGNLDVRYLGVPYPGWYKMWFDSDMLGWHILQYYSNRWSNYVYIYVYSPLPYYEPWFLNSNPWTEVSRSNVRITQRNTVAEKASGPWVDPAPDQTPSDPNIPHW